MITLGKYEIIEKIGEGGCGTVYRAREMALDVEGALKVLRLVICFYWSDYG